MGATLVLLGWTALFFVGVATGDLPPSNSDNTRYFVPAFAFMRNALGDGHFPLWNPYQLAGGPFLALHSPGVTYPLLLPFVVFPAHIAAVVHSVVHVFLAALFTYVFARSVGLGRSGSIAAGLTFAGSSHVLSAAVDNSAYLSAITWLPAVLWGVRRVVVSPTLRDGVLFSAVVAMCFLGGYSQGFLFIVQAGFLYAAYLMLTGPAARVRTIMILAGGGLLALGLVAMQLLPTLGHVAGATRDLDGLTFRQAARYPVAAQSIVQAFLGRGEGLMTLPVLLVPLALASVFGRRGRRELWFFVLLFAVTLDFMRGGFGTVFPMYFRLPYGDVFRIPARIGFVTGFAAAMLVGFGVSAIVDRLRRWPLAAPVAAFVLIAGVGVDQLIQNTPRVAFDALVHPETIYGPPEVVALSEEWGYDRFFLVGSAVEKTLGEVHGRFMAGSYEPLLPGAYARYFGIPPEMIWHGQLYVLPSRRAPRHRPRSIAQSPDLLDLLSVRYYADIRPGGSPRLSRIVGAPPEVRGSVRVHERPSAVPRVYVVHDAIEATTVDDALEVVRSGALDPLLAAVVESPVAPMEPPSAGATEGAWIEAYEPNRVAVRAQCATDCLLVLTDLYDPDWGVHVGGRAAEILRVNALVRGVRLPAGEHSVEFEYSPTSLRIGLGLSLGSLLLALALAFVRPGRPA